jgi:hypothetical protein
MTTSTAKTGKRITLVSLAAIALLVGFTSGLAYSQANWTALAEARGQASDQLGAMEASRKVRCIMPPAWRQACGE